jgi:hypothetical protein
VRVGDGDGGAGIGCLDERSGLGAAQATHLLPPYGHAPSRVRYFLTNGSDTRIYQQLNAGERRQYKIGIVVDRSASVMGTVALQANAVCATMMALGRMGLDTSTAVVSFGGCDSLRTACWLLRVA